MALALRYIGTKQQQATSPAGPSSPGSRPKLNEEFVVTTEGLVLGRSQNADVPFFGSGTVARQHVKITLSEDGAAIIAQDLQSTNGTQKNGVTASLHRLEVGDVLSLAELFDFLVVDQAPTDDATDRLVE